MNNDKNSHFLNTINNKTKHKDQANIHHGTEKHNRTGDRDIKYIIHIDDGTPEGKNIPISENVSIIDPDTNRSVRVHITQCEYDELGTLTESHKLTDYSWTGKKIPPGYKATCANKFGDHKERIVFLGEDGKPSDLGWILCDECFDKNKKLLKCKKGWRKVITFGQYNPDTY